MKDNLVLVDTSAWILSFRKTGAERLKAFLREAIEGNRVVTTPLIILELLQGCTAEKELEILKTRLEALEFCPMDGFNWDGVYSLGFSLRRKGLTIPTLDILIASLAAENGYTLLHHDHHFRMIVVQLKLDVVDFME